ncbi:jumonji domain-containing 3 [Diplodia corticola]|uniref:Jumonji domain-containing 3 n=1 Tax=Diplodia corticola TaxID=236234 RepID=A0A1J9R4W6_9PEZI|nr:jumonji domain-containing 3 [Diplodia corticola]OJD35274.1 jumonji domain-containing 3 [Diplodia corticola]
MASAGTSRPPPVAQPPPANMADNRPRGIVLAEVAGKALFSTKLGQVAPRPVSDPPEPVIARAPNMKMEIEHQIDRFVQQLRDEFPTQCKEIFVGYYTIHDYFDAHDIHRLGEKYLASALDCIAKQNSTAVQDFVNDWCPRNHDKVLKICYGTTLQELFSEGEIKDRGELFFTIAVISIRNALEATAKKQQAREMARTCATRSEDTSGKQEAPQAGPEPNDQSQTYKVAPGLLRVGWRQPHSSPAAQVDTVQPIATTRSSSIAVPPGPIMQPHASLRKNSQANTSGPATPTLAEQTTYSSAKSNSSRNTPRVPPYHSNIGMVPPTHQKNHSTPRMNALTPGFIPQSAMCAPASVGHTHGPHSQTTTPQGIAAQLYFPPGPYQGIHHGFEAGPMHRELNPYANFPGPYNMQSNNPDMNYTTPQATPHMHVAQPAGVPGPVSYVPIPAFTSPSMVQPGLASMTNFHYGATAQDMRPRRMSGPASRHDYGPRSQNKQFGRGPRGGRRNSVRGNYNGGNFRAPAPGLMSSAGDSPFNSRLPASSSEPFPAFSPHFEASRMAESGNPPPNIRDFKPVVWVHNIHHSLSQDEAAKELKSHFEHLLNRPVMDVKVSTDKNNHAYALITMGSFYDANLALGLHQSLFFGRQLTVKVPTKHEQRMPPGHDLTKGYPLSAPRQPAQTPHANQTVFINPNEPGVMGTLDNSRRLSASERCVSAATSNRRSRGPSRTYEASADNPMSYSPQDARRLQPTEVSKQATGDTTQTSEDNTHAVRDDTQATQATQATQSTQAPQCLPTSTTATPTADVAVQRPESRASSSATSTKQRKWSSKRGKKGGSNKSRSGTTTPEPSTASTTERTAIVGRQSPLESATKSHHDDAGLVDKKMTTILQLREQEKQRRPTFPEGQSSNESVSTHATAEGKASLTQEDCEGTIAGEGKDGGVVDMADTNAVEPEKSSTNQGIAGESGTQIDSGKLERPGSNLRRAEVALPDINLHSRKEKQGTPSATSSTRVSYAQAAASGKAPIAMINSAVSTRSPVMEREAESSYCTPVETLPSPAKSETSALITPTKVTMGQTEYATPDKDDSFVTVLEEPSSVTKEGITFADLLHVSNEQADDSSTISPGGADTSTTAFADEPQAASSTIAAKVHSQASPAQIGEASASASTSSKAEDVAKHAEPGSPVEIKPSSPTETKPSSPIETKSRASEDTDQTDNLETGGSEVAGGPVKTAQPSGSIHPNARSKSDKKKQAKKGKSYGKGKKGSLGSPSDGGFELVDIPSGNDFELVDPPSGDDFELVTPADESDISTKSDSDDNMIIVKTSGTIRSC